MITGFRTCTHTQEIASIKGQMVECVQCYKYPGTVIDLKQTVRLVRKRATTKFVKAFSFLVDYMLLKKLLLLLLLFLVFCTMHTVYVVCCVGVCM